MEFDPYLELDEEFGIPLRKPRRFPRSPRRSEPLPYGRAPPPVRERELPYGREPLKNRDSSFDYYAVDDRARVNYQQDVRKSEWPKTQIRTKPIHVFERMRPRNRPKHFSL